MHTNDSCRKEPSNNHDNVDIDQLRHILHLNSLKNYAADTFSCIRAVRNSNLSRRFYPSTAGAAYIRVFIFH